MQNIRHTPLSAQERENLKITDMRFCRYRRDAKALYASQTLYQRGHRWLWGGTGRCNQNLCRPLKMPGCWVKIL